MVITGCNSLWLCQRQFLCMDILNTALDFIKMRQQRITEKVIKLPYTLTFMLQNKLSPSKLKVRAISN